MNKYELLYIVSSDYTDAEVEEIQAKVAQILEKSKAKISRNESLGRIKLAYPVKKSKHGTYVLVHFEAEAEVITDINRTLKLTEEVLRHQIVNLLPGQEDKKIELMAYVQPLLEEAPKREKPQIVHKIPEIAPPPPVAADEKPMSIEELDDKLDKILEDDITKGI